MMNSAAAGPNPTESGCVALISFRVRCEKLGHGDGVFLSRSDDPNMARLIPLYTTATNYPWYSTSSPLAVTLPSQELGDDDKHKVCSYRYAIYRAGKFYRWEEHADAPPDDDVAMDVTHQQPPPSTSPENNFYHEVPLKMLVEGESYIVNDLLGVVSGPPAIDHVNTQTARVRDASGLFSRSGSGAALSNGSLSALGASPATTAHRKKVGFAPAPPSYHNHNPLVSNKRNVHLDSTDGLVVVSAFLPVHLHRSDTGEWSADWDYEALLSMQTHLRVTRVGTVKWRGWHGNHGVAGSPEGGVPVSERAKVEDCLRPFNCVPVWIETSLFGQMYNGFCKGVLWPILHNVTSVYSSRKGTKTEDRRDMASDEDQFSEVCTDDLAQGPIHGDGGKEAELWSAYTAVNRHFANTVVQCFNEGDMVWIHGFHLMVLPSYLIRRIPMAKVGLFLHTPFPSSEIFRTVWCREDLLRGMLNADQVGFHLFEYGRHFLTCCRRLLGLNYGMIPDASGGFNLAIESNGRHVTITSIHAGVEPQVLNQILTYNSTLEKAYAIRQQYQGKIVFCAIDRLESLKGIPLKLLGLERFLQRCPEWAGKIVLIQVGISAFERFDDYVKTKKEVLEMVTKLNSQWPGCVQFEECDESQMRLQQRMALLRAADVVLVTPIRDGLNLTPLEFTLAHQDALLPIGRNDGRKRGVCILSEFSSCTRVMRGALHVNPWKVAELAHAYHQAVTMSEDERLRRLSTASEFVTRVTTQRWALAVMLDLKGVTKADSVQYSGAGLGLGYRLLGMDTGFQSLDTNAVAKQFKNARSRLILLDYGGTILRNDNLDRLTRFQVVKQVRAPSLPTESIISTLKDLCSDKKNVVFVVSGKERHSLAKTLNHIPNLGLAAEHGMFISWPTSKVGGKRVWETIVPQQDRSWRSIAISIMEVYTSRTHGSYIEETEMKVLWQYRDADPEFGYLQARELEDHLANVLRSFSVDILHGGVEEGGYVEVRPKGVNKGVLAMHVIQHGSQMGGGQKLDFALVMGDDHCDEPMLSVVRQIGRRASNSRRARRGEDPLNDLPASVTLVDVSSCDDYIQPEFEAVTCTVGKKPSAADSYVHDVDEALEFLESLARLTSRVHKYYSSIDLRSFDGNSAGNSFVDNHQPVQTSWGSAFGGSIGSNNSGTGFTRSMSLTEMGGDLGETHQVDRKVSANLNEFLGMGVIEDEEEAEDDDAFFF
mmetsp:Transcript_17246/g.26687  ORF Transcript_17246/g.26687 Transcript_17246/m.26687 type:complete len:1217 (+) Transcript_17246:65-3715(+)